MAAHPEITHVSRDRGAEYASCKWKEKVAAFGRDTCRFLPHIASKVALSITQPEEILAVILKRKEIPAALSEGTTPCFSENSTGLRSGERADQEMRSFTEKTRERAAEARFQAQRNREVKVAARNRKT